MRGMCNPSSNTSRASMARRRPPMSGMCDVVAEKATRRPARKSGLSTLTSLMCLVPIQASLVMRTSPGRIAAAPIARRKWRTVAGRVPMNEGMLPVFCASEQPRASVSMQAKSFASFESVENDVRTIALAASSTTEMSRVQSPSSVIASNPRLTVSPSPAASSSERHDDVPGRRDREARTWIDDQRRALFLDHRRPREAVADREASAVVHGRLDEPAGLREPDGPSPLDGLLGSTAGAALEYDFTTRDGSAHGDTDVDELDRHVWRCERELLAIRRLEGRRERSSRGVRVASVVGTVGQRDHQVEPLPQKAPVGEALEARGLELEAGIGHDGARLVLEGAERRLER